MKNYRLLLVLALVLTFGQASPKMLFAQASWNTKLPIPPTIEGPNNYYLRMHDSTHVFYPGGKTIKTYGYDSNEVLGPTIIWHVGDVVQMHVENQLDEEATNHWHGAHLPPCDDGGPHQMIPKHTTWSPPPFRIMDPPCTMWYHPHLHMMTMEQVAKGLAGLIIIKDANDPFEAKLPHTYGVDDIPLIVQDKWLINDSSEINTNCSMGHGYCVNGVQDAVLTVPAQQIRFRILAGSSERGWMLGVMDSAALAKYPNDLQVLNSQGQDSLNIDSSMAERFSLIATDAGYTAAPSPMGAVMMGPGERTEWVVDFSKALPGHVYYFVNFPEDLPSSIPGSSNPNSVPGCQSGKLAYGLNRTDSVPTVLMKIVIEKQNGSPAPPIPKVFAKLNLPDTSKPYRTRYKHLYPYNSDPNAAPFSIDNTNFNPNVINDTVILGAVEDWQIINVSGVAHPFHIHDVSFIVTAINGRSGDSVIPAYLRGPKDVIFVQDDQTIDYITQFNDFYTAADPDSCYMYHCHILDHEDGGMMHQFVVVKPTSGVPVKFSNTDFVPWDVYPNPSAGGLHISGECDQASTIRIFNLLGMKSAEIPIAPLHGATPLTIPKLAKGLWTVQWSRPDGVFTKRVVIQ